jgi:hypothetical protein
VTERWHRNHAVYKSAGPLVEQLLDKYDLTLVWTNPPDREPPTIVKEYFDKVVHCYFKADGNLVIPDELMNNDLQMIYYPDIGMSDESVWMSNMRFAPIQAVGYGHPDTTGDGNEIDYFLCGDVEKNADDAYSELVYVFRGSPKCQHGQQPSDNTTTTTMTLCVSIVYGTGQVQLYTADFVEVNK